MGFQNAVNIPEGRQHIEALVTWQRVLPRTASGLSFGVQPPAVHLAGSGYATGMGAARGYARKLETTSNQRGGRYKKSGD